MAIDKLALGEIQDQEEEEAKKSGRILGSKRRFDEWECPGCSAYNPREDFGHGEELMCSYCGLSYLAEVDDEGTLHLKEA